MKKIIIPSIIAKNQEELDERIKKVKNHASLLQLDVMDGKFVKGRSLDFNFKLPKGKYEMQLMVKDPEEWIKKHGNKADVIIPSLEGCKYTDKIIKLIKQKRKKVGLAINPETSVDKIKKYLAKIDQVTVMTVHPGSYGARFLPNTLEKVRELRRLKPKLNIEVDGGIKLNTIKKARDAGANLFVCGSYIQKSKDAKKAIEMLKERL